MAREKKKCWRAMNPTDPSEEELKVLYKYLIKADAEINEWTFSGEIWHGIKALIASYSREARVDEVDTAIEMTRQTFHKDSPFTNIENINNQVIAATSQYLLTRKLTLQEGKDNG